MRSPNFQSLGTTSSIHIASNNLYKISTVVLISAFRASGGMWSGPAAFPLFKCLIARLISSLLGRSQLISRSTSAGKISGVVLGAGLFKSSLKCSAHLFNWSSVLVKTFPSLSFIGVVTYRCFPERVFVILYSSFRLPLPAASSASVANCSK